MLASNHALYFKSLGKFPRVLNNLIGPTREHPGAKNISAPSQETPATRQDGSSPACLGQNAAQDQDKEHYREYLWGRAVLAVPARSVAPRQRVRWHRVGLRKLEGNSVPHSGGHEQQRDATNATGRLARPKSGRRSA